MSANYNSDTAPHFCRKSIGESGEYYARRRLDPLASVFPEGDEAVSIRIADVAGLSGATERRDLAETLEFATDLAYLDFIEGRESVLAYTTIAIDAAKEWLKKPDLKSSDELSIYMRVLDLTNLEAFENYRRASLIGDKSNQAKVLKSLEAQVQTVIIQGANALARSQKQLIALADNNKLSAIEERSLLVGKMFELFAITNRRRELYENEQYDALLVLGASSFQDGPAIVFDPNHNFDFMEIANDGLVKRLVQCKSGQSSKFYEKSIDMVSGRSISKFLENPELYLRALKIAVSNNNPSVTEKQMLQAIEVVESLIDNPNKVARSSGFITRRLVSV